MSSWQSRSMRLAVVRVPFFGDVKGQHTYSAVIETLLVCNVYLVKQFYANKQNIPFVSMTDDVYVTRA